MSAPPRRERETRRLSSWLRPFRLLDHAALGEREEQPDRRQDQHDRDAEDDQERRERRARRGGVRDLQRLRKEIRILGDTPTPDDRDDRADRERAAPSLHAAVVAVVWGW